MKTMSKPLPAWQRILIRNRTSLIVAAVLVILVIIGYIVDPNVTTAVLASTLRHSPPLVLGP